MKVKAITTKPLDGQPEGAEREFDQPDFERLERMGAVRRATVPSEPSIAPETVPLAPVDVSPARRRARD